MLLCGVHALILAGLDVFMGGGGGGLVVLFGHSSPLERHAVSLG